MAVRRGQTEFRNVTVTFNDAVGQDIVDQTAQLEMPIDAYKAAIVKVEEIEGVYATLGSFTDLTDTTVLVTGTSPHRIYVFDLTTVIADGEYMFIFVEERPNALNEA